jgi:hypothetical protein
MMIRKDLRLEAIASLVDDLPILLTQGTEKGQLLLFHKVDRSKTRGCEEISVQSDSYVEAIIPNRLYQIGSKTLVLWFNDVRCAARDRWCDHAPLFMRLVGLVGNRPQHSPNFGGFIQIIQSCNHFTLEDADLREDPHGEAHHARS